MSDISWSEEMVRYAFGPRTQAEQDAIDREIDAELFEKAMWEGRSQEEMDAEAREHAAWRQEQKRRREGP